LGEWLRVNFSYQAETTAEEHWKSPKETVRDRGGDCIGENEKIWTKRGLIKAKDVLKSDRVLSYNFDLKKHEYKHILKIWKKGVKQLYRVHFSNGTFIEVTGNHKMIVKDKEEYFTKTVNELDVYKRDKPRVPTFRNLPYKIKDISWLNEDLCFLIGHYVAEGYNDTKHIRTCGYDCIDEIIPLLKKNNIPYSLYFNKKKLPIITYLKPPFKEYLRGLKTNCRNITLYDELLNLPKIKLQKIIDGFFLGDGHYNDFDFASPYADNKKYILSTSSFQFTKDLQTMGLKLGKPFHVWKQEHHGGVGTHPIWRISYNTNSYFSKDYGYKNLSEVSIKKIEKIGKEETYDFMVEDNHNFVMENGVIVHNCEDLAFLAEHVLEKLGYKVYVVIVEYKNDSQKHAIAVIRHRDKTFSYYSNLTYFPNRH